MSDTSNPATAAGDSAKKRVHIKSYGCQMNVHDAERMADVLAQEGYEITEDGEGADLVILNTCHIREKAAEKVYSELGRQRVIKAARAAAGKKTLIAVAGCLAQAEGEEMIRRQSAVDIVVGPQSYHRLPDLLRRAQAEEGGPARAIDTEFPEKDKFAFLPAPEKTRLRARGPTAFLTVQEGCDKFCAFCVVPFTRGAEISRPVAAIVAEACQMVAAGVREIMLLGQNVNAYHGADTDGKTASLADLLAHLSKVEGLERLRYATSHPCDMQDDLIAAHRDLPKLMPYLHLPVQSGSDRVLAAMNRRHNRDFYLDIIARMRAARPDIAITSDFIIGFPGESEADFEATLDLVRRVGFASAYSFKYSARPGTRSAQGRDDVPEPVKNARLYALQALITAQQNAFNAASLGRTFPVLFEKPGRHPGQAQGKSPYLQAVHVNVGEAAATGLIGQLANVTVTALASNSLHAVLADSGGSARDKGGEAA